MNIHLTFEAFYISGYTGLSDAPTITIFLTVLPCVTIVSNPQMLLNFCLKYEPWVRTGTDKAAVVERLARAGAPDQPVCELSARGTAEAEEVVLCSRAPRCKDGN